MKCIDEVSAEELKGKRVLLRAGLDLPVTDKGEVGDLYRLVRSLPTMQYLRERGARIILLSKVGRDPGATNAPIAEALRKHLPVFFVPDITGSQAREAANAMKEGEILFLENLQRDPREIAGDESFARELASMGDLYVNDAFASAHRTSATMTQVPILLPSYGGLLLCEEVRALDDARTPLSPSFAIIGGAKFETKEPLIKLLMEKYDRVFVTGALSNDVFKARGLSVGISLTSQEPPDPSVLQHPHFLAPVDMTVELPNKQGRVKKPEEIAANDKIVDIGPDSLALIAPYLEAAQFILWNGPTGLYEDGFMSWTHAIAEIIARRVAAGAHAVIGGGDTIAAIEGSGVSIKDLGFVSTGGGSMLEYLLKGTLPALEALK